MDYNPQTGLLRWKTYRGSSAQIGYVAGCVQKKGIRIGIKGRMYLAHRLAYLIMTGEWPKDQIDHKNHDVFDNRWENLRSCSARENARNRKKRIDSGNSKKGVHKIRDGYRKNPWMAYISTNEGRRLLGYFPTEKDAHAAYDKAAREEYGEFFNESNSSDIEESEYKKIFIEEQKKSKRDKKWHP